MESVVRNDGITKRSEIDKMKQVIDLHMHSTASDGTDTIPQLLGKLREAGITTFAVTDHDTMNGSREMEALVPSDMHFIRGIEFSCITPAGKCHILAYGCDWDHEAFQAVLEEGKALRRNKLERRLNFLKDNFNIVLTEEDMAILHKSGSVGKPHLGNLLAAKGLAPDKNAAIDKYINPCKTESDRIDGIKVIKAILQAGGIPVWAHPFGGTGEKRVSYENFRKQLDLLTAAGLEGLECYYCIYNDEQIDLLLQAAREKGLSISGGSDYHGRNKKVSLGELNAACRIVDQEMLTILARL